MFVYTDNDCQDDEEIFDFRRAFDSQSRLQSISSIQNDGTKDYYNIFFSDPYAVDFDDQPNNISVTFNSRLTEITNEIDFYDLSASSIYPNKLLEYMFDLDLNNFVAHTNNSVNEEPEWIEIGFKLNREISKVKFYNRPTQCPSPAGY